MVPARALYSSHSSDVSSIFNTNAEDFAFSRASITRQFFPRPNSCPNVSSGVIAKYHPPAVIPPPVPLEVARNLKYC